MQHKIVSSQVVSLLWRWHCLALCSLLYYEIKISNVSFDRWLSSGSMRHLGLQGYARLGTVWIALHGFGTKVETQEVENVIFF